MLLFGKDFGKYQGNLFSFLLLTRLQVKLAPQGNVLPQAAKVLAYAARDRFRLDAAKPTYQFERYGRSVSWNDHFIAEIKRGLIACKVMSVP